MTRNPSISLTEHQQRFIASLVDSGRYHGVSEVVRAGLRLLEGQEEKRQAVLRRLEAAVDEGLNSGEPTPLEPIEDLTAGAEALADAESVVALSECDWRVLCEALVNPPEPNEVLRRAFAMYRRDRNRPAD